MARTNPAAVDRKTEWTYNGGGNPLSETRRALGVPGVADRVTTTAYQGSTSLVKSSTVENGATDLVTQFTYDARGNVLASTDPASSTTTTTYDVLGRKSTEALPPVAVEENGTPLSPASQAPTTRYGYDTFGNQTHVKDPNGNLTATTYNFLDRQTKITHPSYVPPGGSTITPTEEFWYDNVGNLVFKKGRQVASATVYEDLSIYEYDRLNRVLTSREPSMTGGTKAWAVTSKVYDPVGNVTHEVKPSGAITDFTYDMLNRVRTTTERVRQPTVSISTTVSDYDRLGNLTWQRDPRGFVSTATYNAAGDKLTSTDQRNYTTTFTPSPFGEVLKAVDPTNRCTAATFDRAGRKTAESVGCQLGDSSKWLTTSTSYDGAGRPVSVTSPEGRKVTSSYDAAGGSAPSPRGRAPRRPPPATSTTAPATTPGSAGAGATRRATRTST